MGLCHSLSIAPSHLLPRPASLRAEVAATVSQQLAPPSISVGALERLRSSANPLKSKISIGALGGVAQVHKILCVET